MPLQEFTSPVQSEEVIWEDLFICSKSNYTDTSFYNIKKFRLKYLLWGLQSLNPLITLGVIQNIFFPVKPKKRRCNWALLIYNSRWTVLDQEFYWTLQMFPLLRDRGCYTQSGVAVETQPSPSCRCLYVGGGVVDWRVELLPTMPGPMKFSILESDHDAEHLH